MTDLVANIVSAVKSVTGNQDGLVALHEPRFAGHEWDYVKECIDTGWVSTAGRYVGEFEKRLAARCGVEDAIAVVNGTAALHLALMVAGVKPGDEVIVPTLTFVASANAVMHANATPHFADCETSSLGIDAAKLDRHLSTCAERRPDGSFNKASGRRISAIVPMHVFGHPVDMDAIAEVARKHGLVVVEDAAEGIGSTYKSRPIGSLGLVSALSFNGNKIVTTGGGGAVLTNDREIGKLARHIGTTARLARGWEFDHDQVGYNYRMPNINAALGCAQLEQLDGFLASKRQLVDRYDAALRAIDGVRIVREPSGTQSNYWLVALLLDEDREALRDPLLAALNEANLQSRPVWRLMHRLPMYGDCPRMDLSTAESLERRIVNIPSSAVLGMQRQ